ncbi:MAG: hypothetical protein SFZ23_00655 [Planctomycetota bacterium]|nr:hypothetical protein [Planctomycetota bacterium]
MSHDPHHPEHASGASHAGTPHTTPVIHEDLDEWHRHPAEDGMPQEEHGKIAKPSVIAAYFFGLILAIVLFVAPVILYFQRYTTNVKAKQVETTALARDYQSYKAASDSAADGYSWVDQSNGKVRTPIDSAMERVAAAYARGEQPASVPPGSSIPASEPASSQPAAARPDNPAPGSTPGTATPANPGSSTDPSPAQSTSPGSSDQPR